MSDDIHSCSLFCDRPECIKAQRDEMRGEIERLRSEVVRLGGPDGVVSKINSRCDHLGMRLGEVIRERDALLEQVAAQKLTILNAWQRGEHLEDEASRWEERARHVGWRDEHGA